MLLRRRAPASWSSSALALTMRSVIMDPYLTEGCAVENHTAHYHCLGRCPPNAPHRPDNGRPEYYGADPMARPAARLPLNTSHSIGMSVSTQEIQRRGLRRNRLIATALLGAMAALFISTTLASQPGFWILLVRATAQAALVGGLADLVAVTALFRQPLGLPIPHPAILPKNTDRIREGFPLSLERNFLSPHALTPDIPP